MQNEDRQSTFTLLQQLYPLLFYLTLHSVRGIVEMRRWDALRNSKIKRSKV